MGELSMHIARAVLPASIARLFVAYPQIVAVAADHLPPPPPRDMVRFRRELVGNEVNLHIDCEGRSDEETVCIGVRFTRLQYARLIGLKCQLPQRFNQKRWRQPPGGNVDDKAMQLGAMLCCGLE